MKEMTLQELKELFSSHLCEPDRMKRPEGLATGHEDLDRYLLWKGVPKGALSLFCGSLGTGSTSLWIETATQAVRAGRWAAWINHDIPLAPHSLFHRDVDLGKFVCVEKPENEEKLFWLLQEMMASSLFDLIGCDISALRLKAHQLRKLQAQAREAHIALVFISQLRPFQGPAASVFSLILHFESKQILIERASHKPVPHSLPRSVTYARFTHHIDSQRTENPGHRLGLTSDGQKQLAHPGAET
jgi:hypothetical protein